MSVVPTIEILAYPVDRRGNFDVRFGGVILCHRTSTPFLTAARCLLERGHNPNALLVLWHDGVPSLRGLLQDAAGLTVEECGDGRPRFRAF
jgi:hypothetical protein